LRLTGCLITRRSPSSAKRHEAALSELFGEVLELCREAGLVRVGVIAVDGTKVHANASNMVNRDFRQIAEEILADAARIDREEDELYGEKRGDEMPVEVSTHKGRREWLREAKRRLDENRERESEPVPRLSACAAARGEDPAAGGAMGRATR
jgi:hypothetical protein